MTVLIVEDDDNQRQLLQRGLEKARFQVSSCGTLQQAIECLDRGSFAVAVVDLSLSDQNGLDFIRELVKRSAKTKVIIHTANASFESAQAGIELGVFAYVEKSRGLAPLLDQVIRASTVYLRESLSSAEEEIRLQIRLLDSVQEGVIATDLHHSVIFANLYALDLLGYSDKEIRGKNAITIFECPNRADTNHPQEQSWMLSGFESTQCWESEMELWLKCNHTRRTPNDQEHKRTSLRLTIFPILDPELNPVGHVMIFADITSQKASEYELEKARNIANHAQRISIIGQMAGVLSHEINQPLGAISNFAGGLMLGLQNSQISNEELESTLHKIQTQAIRASEIIGQLRRFVASTATVQNVFDIHPLITDSIKLMECDFRAHRVNIDLQLNALSPFIIGDRVQLTQVVVNVLKNAAEAINIGDAANRTITIDSSSTQSKIQVRITDHGPGIAPEVLHRISQPYFTTKAGGLGLGLSISKAIMENHRGSLTLENQSACGLTVILQLPLAPPPI